MSSCIVCGKKFKEGDYLQAFLRCPEDPNGSWTEPVLVDSEYQTRANAICDKIKRKHKECNKLEK